MVKTIRERGCRKILLQFPEGLKRRSAAVATAIAGQTGAIIVISGEPCFGACDIPETDADLIVHYGHLPIPDLQTPRSVMYIQARSNSDPFPALELALPSLHGTVGLLTTAQHVHIFDDMVAYLRQKGVNVSVGKGDGRIYSVGQVLGCNASSARAIAESADMFLFVGAGNFHPLAIALATSLPVIIADPERTEIRDISEFKDRVLRQRHAAIETAKQAKNIGILVSRMSGQKREKDAHHLSAILTAAGFETFIFEMGLITQAKLDAFGMDAWVSTACPRLAIDDHAAFSKPILTVTEAEILSGKRVWDNYIFDEIV